MKQLVSATNSGAGAAAAAVVIAVARSISSVLKISPYDITTNACLPYVG